MTVFAVVLYSAIILVALMLIALVLVQQSKSGGLGGTFGGVGESIMGGQATSHLSKLTVYLSIVFFVLVLLIAVMIGRGWATTSSVKMEVQQETQVEKAIQQAQSEMKVEEKAADLKEDLTKSVDKK